MDSGTEAPFPGFLWFLLSHLRLFPFMWRIPSSGFKRVPWREKNCPRAWSLHSGGGTESNTTLEGLRQHFPPHELMSTKWGWPDGQSSKSRWSGGQHCGVFLSGPLAFFLGEWTAAQSGDPFTGSGTVEIHWLTSLVHSSHPLGWTWCY